MEVSPQDPSVMAMDLSKGFSVNPLSRGHTEAMDLAKKPEWYHRRLPSCNTEISSPYRSRASSSYNSHPGLHCRDMEQGPESLSSYMNSTLAPGMYPNNNLWHAGFSVPESSGGEESDSGSDVIFLVSSAKEPLLCSSFLQDSMRHIVEPLSPAVSSLEEEQGCYHLPQPLSSPSPDSSDSEDSSDSSMDIPIHHARPVVLLSDLNTAYAHPAEALMDISSDDSDVIEVSVTSKNKKTVSCKKSLARETPPQSEDEKAPPRKIRRSPRIRKYVSEIPQYTCSVSPRSVTRYSLRRQAKNDVVGIYNESCDSDDMMGYEARLSSLDTEESASQPNVSQRVSSNSEESDAASQTDRKSPQREQQPRSKAINYGKCHGLGDLHGPYYPTGPSLQCKTEQKEDGQLNASRGSVNSDNDCNGGKILLEGDNHSLPKVPLCVDEGWIHADCGIWSTGVFLVGGKLYGLEEAAQLAQETKCSACQQTGAIMGCFQKGCHRSYHYSCANQSGCVLKEDNFSIRCPEHKKPFTCVNKQHNR
ncbi:hypothetical protein PBY51_007479 [Eleginops maclovinus]|uniref:PHD-type domain-containing protein n=1 Tax=Eleginops maclovinus TaxID=56733 RepID=A0AAN8ADH1_ELEMC|nr:hypothetical protein PBY51_007479 [Eleginops maclovinus]